MSKLRTVGSGAFLLAVVGLLVGAAGGVAAADAEVANETVSVDNDTRSVYADVEAGNTSVDLRVEFTANGSTLGTQNVSLNASESQLVEQSVDGSAHDSVRVMVTAPNLNTTNATAEIGSVKEVAGGGGGIGGAVEQAGGIGVVVLIGGAAAILLMGDD